MVDLEGQLDPVARHDAPLGDQAGVVDEHVERRQRLRQRAHLRQDAEVGEVHAGGADLLRDRLRALLAAAVDVHGEPPRGEVGGDDAAEAVGGAGDEDGGHGHPRSSRTRFGSDSTTRS